MKFSFPFSFIAIWKRLRKRQEKGKMKNAFSKCTHVLFDSCPLLMSGINTFHCHLIQRQGLNPQGTPSTSALSSTLLRTYSRMTDTTPLPHYSHNLLRAQSQFTAGPTVSLMQTDDGTNNIHSCL